MREEDLWIGDYVRLLMSNHTGKYEGKHKNGKAIIRIADKKVLTNYQNLELLPDPTPPTVPLIEDDSEDIPIQRPDMAIIDLHIEKLAPEIQHQPSQIILRKQLTSAKTFIESAIRSGWPNATIIHGLGAGELKKEVHFLLNQYEEVSDKSLVNNGGATYVTFRFA